MADDEKPLATSGVQEILVPERVVDSLPTMYKWGDPSATLVIISLIVHVDHNLGWKSGVLDGATPTKLAHERIM